MVAQVSKKDLDKLADVLLSEFNSEECLDAFTNALRKRFWESTLDGKLDDHLGHEKQDPKGNGSGNSRTGKSKKRLKSENGELEIDVPRDRNG